MTLQNLAKIGQLKPHKAMRKFAWRSLLARDGDELFDHYRRALKGRANQMG